MNNAIEISNVNKHYDNFSLENVSFNVPKGYITGFVGPNGAGKTTTLKTILGMTNFQTGQIKIHGKDIKKNTENLNDKLGVVMDAPFYVEDWTAIDLEKALSPFYQSWDSNKYAELLGRFAISNKKKIRELSRGMKVKLMIGVALSHDADILILDEPTSGLDPVARDEFCDLVSEFVTDDKKSVIFSTHITSDLEKIADYIVFIQEGKIVYKGQKDKLIEDYALIKGGLEDINDEEKQHIIGFRKHSAGFEGMVNTASLSKLSASFLVEPITLEEIIIYMNREGKSNG